MAISAHAVETLIDGVGNHIRSQAIFAQVRPLSLSEILQRQNTINDYRFLKADQRYDEVILKEETRDIEEPPSSTVRVKPCMTE